MWWSDLIHLLLGKGRILLGIVSYFIILIMVIEIQGLMTLCAENLYFNVHVSTQELHISPYLFLFIFWICDFSASLPYYFFFDLLTTPNLFGVNILQQCSPFWAILGKYLFLES